MMATQEEAMNDSLMGEKGHLANERMYQMERGRGTFSPDDIIVYYTMSDVSLYRDERTRVAERERERERGVSIR